MKVISMDKTHNQKGGFLLQL